MPNLWHALVDVHRASAARRDLELTRRPSAIEGKTLALQVGRIEITPCRSRPGGDYSRFTEYCPFQKYIAM